MNTQPIATARDADLRLSVAAMHRAAMHLLGAAAELRQFADQGINQWLEGYIFSLSGPIYAGSNEVQRNITAERLLGLPRIGNG